MMFFIIDINMLDNKNQELGDARNFPVQKQIRFCVHSEAHFLQKNIQPLDFDFGRKWASLKYSTYMKWS